MPLVDVSDILNDPDIAGQEFIVLRRQEVVNDFGESTISVEKIPELFGSIQPEGDNDLIREDSLDAQSKTVIIVTSFRLRGVAKGPNKSRFKPDIIFYEDTYYEVMSLKSWGSFGYGFVEATATSIKYVDTPPEYPPLEFGQLDFSRPVNAGYAYGAGGAC